MEYFPIPNLAAFKEICPGGMGYTVLAFIDAAEPSLM